MYFFEGGEVGRCVMTWDSRPRAGETLGALPFNRTNHIL